MWTDIDYMDAVSYREERGREGGRKGGREERGREDRR